MKPLSLLKTTFIGLSALVSSDALSQTIGTFNSVSPGTQSQTLVLPATHTFQRLIKTGDALSLGGTLGNNLDFTGYIPTAGSSRNGRLSISTENTPAEVAILDISYNNSSHTWSVGAGGKVTFNPTHIGTVSRFCSGTVTPNGTIMVSEEDVATGDVNSDGYTDKGWIIEIDPGTRSVINQAGGNATADKLWAVGRANRENILILSNNQVMYTGTDDPSLGYLYKFVATTPGDFSTGTLYALETTGALGNGKWEVIANTTQADRNNTRTLAQTAGAYNFNGIEDVEVGPDGKIYFTAKGEGKIYRFVDNGTYGTATDVSGLEVFAGNSTPGISYDVDGAGPLGTESWGTGNDNLAFDGEGNLWVLQDGGRNHIWVIRPTHTQASPQVRLFAKTPAGSEPTGITFTPDNKFMFVSFQHPSANTTSQTDAAGTSVIFNTHTTVVIARVENLGPFATLPVNFTSFEAKAASQGVNVNWTVSDIYNHDYFSVERSVDGITFSEIHRIDEDINGGIQRSFAITDNNLPGSTVLYYRVKQCDINGTCKYTEIKQVKMPARVMINKLYPLPAKNELTAVYYSSEEGRATITITDINGKQVYKQNRTLVKGTQSLAINTANLKGGIYVLTITDKLSQQSTQKFVKGE